MVEVNEYPTLDSAERTTYEKIMKHFDLERLFNIVLSVKYWIAVSLLLSLSIAFLYLRYSTPVYKSKISILLLNNEKENPNLQILADIISGKSDAKIDNEIALLKSTPMVERVVQAKGLNVRYFTLGRFKEVELYDHTPVKLIFNPNSGSEDVRIEMGITALSQAGYRITELKVNAREIACPEVEIAFGEQVPLSIGSLTLTYTGEELSSKARYRITRSSVNQTARAFCANLEAIPSTKNSDVILLVVSDPIAQRAEDVLNGLAEAYNADARYYQSRSIMNTIDFLDNRLLSIGEELNRVEDNFKTYRSTNELLDVQSQSQMVLTSDMNHRERLAQVELQRSILSALKGHLQGMKGQSQLFPANIGIEDVNLSGLIDSYNNLVMDRDRFLSSSSVDNPRVAQTVTQINGLKQRIQLSIQSLESAYRIQEETIAKQLKKNRNEITQLPGKQKALSQIERKQQVKEPLYLLLQQKREEALVSLAAISDYSRVIEPASRSGAPTWPNRNLTFVFAFFFGLFVPILVVILYNVLRTKLVFETDIEARTQVPLLSVIPKIVGKSKQYCPTISESEKSTFAESFRMLRSKIDFLNIQKHQEGALVLQVTSSIPGEGKSFVSANLALSLSFTNERVLLISGDLRRPSIHRYLGCERSKKGLSNYLVGKEKEVSSIISKVKGVNNLDVIFSGSHLFNPAELLTSPRMKDLMSQLRSSYDYIIVDTPPFVIVSDSIIMSKLVDAVFCVVRTNYTDLAALRNIEEVYRKRIFRSLFLVMNDVDFKANRYYGAGRSYGYHYGYSYEYTYVGGEYFEDELEVIKSKKNHEIKE